MNRSCKDCDYWLRVNSGFCVEVEGKEGLCKLNPVVVPKDGNDWCGQFELNRNLRNTF